ncbi:hypothetical protein BRADI_4g28745v3 [Brachypodium distachyon]|uniref:Uncharacterized protein n=1 Tax=Brachypodium distachyon TaxID=15368 RepID=I1IPL1_BRADI|nr:hypothetical protein BRADI_4g28745v3 [Brachypodium distachyon]
MDSQIEKFRKKWGHVKEYWTKEQWLEMHPDGDPEFESDGCYVALEMFWCNEVALVH